jgi:glycosyltransferase involved in cell wall biosynthesis
MKKSILIVSNSLRSTIRFRMWMINRMVEEGASVIIAAPFEGLSPVDTHLVKYVNYSMDRKSISLFDNLKTVLTYVKLLKLKKFDMVICYTAKPALFFPLLLSLSKVEVFSIFTGLGSGFLKAENSILVRRISQFLLMFSKSVVVLNSDDKAFLINKVGIRASKVFVLPGEGIDINHYRYSQPVKKNELHFLFIGRLIKDKGVNELLCASKKIHDMGGKKFILTIVGDIDSGNPSSVPPSKILEFSNTDYIRYIPETSSIERYIEQSDVLILPSYREGLSRAALEACSIGRACIVSKTPGLIELVDNSYNGLVVRPRSVESLASAMMDILSRDYREIVLMGKRSRAKLKNKYDLDSVYESFKLIIKDNDI